MQDLIKRREDCRLCHGRNLKLVLKLEKSALANDFVSNPLVVQQSFPLDLFRCESCGNYQILDIIDPSIMFSNYNYASSTSKLMRQHFRNYVCALASEFDLSEEHLVCEIASNDGVMLRWFKCLGIDAFGVDPASNLAQKANDEGLETINDFFNTKTASAILSTKGNVDLVVANNVFAHADDLDEIVNGVKIILKKEGFFVFEVSYFMDVLESGDFSQIYHEHLQYWLVGPMYSYFKKHGMTLYDVKPVDVHGGSIRCFVYNGISNDVCDSVSYYAAKESKNGCYTDESWSKVSKFVKKVNGIKENLRPKLLELKRQGMKIAGVTASAKSTTLLHHCNIGSDILDCIYDDAPEKINKYSPGKHIPVLPFSRMYQDKPDYLVTLSFNFVDFIINKHKEYQGKWIIPINKSDEIIEYSGENK